MLRDVVNGFEWLIFEESEIEQARAMAASGHTHVRIATTCSVCGEYIERSLDQRGLVKHTDAYHDMIERM